MSELVDKLHYKLDSTTDEITLYSTLGEVNNKGLNVKVNGINAYAGYGTEADGEASRMNYKPPTEVAQKVLKQAGEPVLLNLLGYRNNEDLLQALPVTQVTKGSYVHFNNENAPTISGYDFVCAVPNCFVAEENTTVKIYYIPQSVPDRTKTNWSSAFEDASGDLSLQDFANTFCGENFTMAFATANNLLNTPKINTSNATTCMNMFRNCTKLKSIFPMDTKNVRSFIWMFVECSSLDFSINNANIFDLTNAESVMAMFNGCTQITADKPIHLKNVPSNLDLSQIGTEHYIVDNYIN